MKPTVAPKKFSSANVSSKFVANVGVIGGKAGSVPVKSSMCVLKASTRPKTLPKGPAPVSLTSLKAQHAGQDPSIQLVPSGSGSWLKKPENKEELGFQGEVEVKEEAKPLKPAWNRPSSGGVEGSQASMAWGEVQEEMDFSEPLPGMQDDAPADNRYMPRQSQQPRFRARDESDSRYMPQHERQYPQRFAEEDDHHYPPRRQGHDVPVDVPEDNTYRPQRILQRHPQQQHQRVVQDTRHHEEGIVMGVAVSASPQLGNVVDEQQVSPLASKLSETDPDTLYRLQHQEELMKKTAEEHMQKRAEKEKEQADAKAERLRLKLVELERKKQEEVEAAEKAEAAAAPPPAPVVESKATPVVIIHPVVSPPPSTTAISSPSATAPRGGTAKPSATAVSPTVDDVRRSPSSGPTPVVTGAAPPPMRILASTSSTRREGLSYSSLVSGKPDPPPAPVVEEPPKPVEPADSRRRITSKIAGTGGLAGGRPQQQHQPPVPTESESLPATGTAEDKSVGKAERPQRRERPERPPKGGRGSPTGRGPTSKGAGRGGRGSGAIKDTSAAEPDAFVAPVVEVKIGNADDFWTTEVPSPPTVTPAAPPVASPAATTSKTSDKPASATVPTANVQQQRLNKSTRPDRPVRGPAAEPTTLPGASIVPVGPTAVAQAAVTPALVVPAHQFLRGGRKRTTHQVLGLPAPIGAYGPPFTGKSLSGQDGEGGRGSRYVQRNRNKDDGNSGSRTDDNNVHRGPAGSAAPHQGRGSASSSSLVPLSDFAAVGLPGPSQYLQPDIQSADSQSGSHHSLLGVGPQHPRGGESSGSGDANTGRDGAGHNARGKRRHADSTSDSKQGGDGLVKPLHSVRNPGKGQSGGKPSSESSPASNWDRSHSVEQASPSPSPASSSSLRPPTLSTSADCDTYLPRNLVDEMSGVSPPASTRAVPTPAGHAGPPRTGPPPHHKPNLVGGASPGSMHNTSRPAPAPHRPSTPPPPPSAVGVPPSRIPASSGLAPVTTVTDGRGPNAPPRNPNAAGAPPPPPGHPPSQRGHPGVHPAGNGTWQHSPPPPPSHPPPASANFQHFQTTMPPPPPRPPQQPQLDQSVSHFPAGRQPPPPPYSGAAFPPQQPPFHLDEEVSHGAAWPPPPPQPKQQNHYQQQPPRNQQHSQYTGATNLSMIQPAGQSRPSYYSESNGTFDSVSSNAAPRGGGRGGRGGGRGGRGQQQHQQQASNSVHDIGASGSFADSAGPVVESQSGWTAEELSDRGAASAGGGVSGGRGGRGAGRGGRGAGRGGPGRLGHDGEGGGREGRGRGRGRQGDQHHYQITQQHQGSTATMTSTTPTGASVDLAEAHRNRRKPGAKWKEQKTVENANP